MADFGYTPDTFEREIEIGMHHDGFSVHVDTDTREPEYFAIDIDSTGGLDEFVEFLRYLGFNNVNIVDDY